MAVASLVLGIVSLVTCWWIGIVAVITGVIGVILGAMARKNQPEKAGMAIAGLVMSAIGLALGLIFFIACIVACNAAVAYASDPYNYLYY